MTLETLQLSQQRAWQEDEDGSLQLGGVNVHHHHLMTVEPLTNPKT